jgi:hypothetical protein
MDTMTNSREHVLALVEQIGKIARVQTTPTFELHIRQSILELSGLWNKLWTLQILNCATDHDASTPLPPLVSRCAVGSG